MAARTSSRPAAELGHRQQPRPELKAALPKILKGTFAGAAPYFVADLRSARGGHWR